MKKFIAALFVLSGLQIAKAEDASAPVDQKVVELRITRPELGDAANSRFKHKKENMTGHGVCSGSFIDDQGDILTAGHCAADAIEIDVITYDQRRYQATIVATTSVHDLALLHIDRRHTAYFDPATDVAQGETIFILGSPLAFTGTLSTGIIAKVDGDVLLLDCGVLPGNSGSAVYNTRGEMVGVATAGYIVGMGTTHLNVAQSLDAVIYFVIRALRGIKQ
jgi:S1-C subfamily serine protease